jgi:hypothetical protein
MRASTNQRTKKTANTAEVAETTITPSRIISDGNGNRDEHENQDVQSLPASVSF